MLIMTAEIINFDELVFIQKSYSTAAWANKEDNIEASEWWRTEPTITACAVISNKHGQIHYDLKPKSLNKTTFKDFLTQLADKMPNIRNAILILDNSSIHHTNLVRDFIAEWEIHVVWNVRTALILTESNCAWHKQR